MDMKLNSKTKSVNRTVHDIVDSSVLPMYLSIAPSGLPLALAMPGQAIRPNGAICGLYFLVRHSYISFHF